MLYASWLLSLLLAAPAPMASDSVFPATQQAGPFQSGHVQGIAIDRKRGHIYYSFTNMLAKYDFQGRLIGTLNGWTGHLGDLDFNDADGNVYGSLEYGKQDAFYIAVIEGSRIDRVGMHVRDHALLRTVYLPEVTRDYATPDHRYGCSGIDGVAFGPAFGLTSGRHYLTVAYGIYGDVARSDNDHQVLLQYDSSDWSRRALPLDETTLHRNGPERPQIKAFVRTGNTRYGVQNLAYDESLERWFMGVYTGAKPAFPNFGMFAVDARARPLSGELIGVPTSDGAGWERAKLLPLAHDGLRHPSGIRGWHQKADVGLQPLGGGQYALVTNAKTPEGQKAELSLVRWISDSPTPFSSD